MVFNVKLLLVNYKDGKVDCSWLSFFYPMYQVPTSGSTLVFLDQWEWKSFGCLKDERKEKEDEGDSRESENIFSLKSSLAR